MTNLELTDILVRRLRPDDLAVVIALDSKITGQRREEYFKLKLAQALSNTGVEVSLAAEKDSMFAGFLLARVYYGEFGCAEDVAVLDTLDVHPELRGQGIGDALIQQLRTNLLGLGIHTLQTEVAFEDQDLMAFFQREGFRLANRVCLDLDLDASRRRAEVAENSP